MSSPGATPWVYDLCPNGAWGDDRGATTPGFVICASAMPCAVACRPYRAGVYRPDGAGNEHQRGGVTNKPGQRPGLLHVAPLERRRSG
jgi:hypothetical protein